MITIIFAPPRSGKTVLMSHLLNQAAFNRERTRLMNNEIRGKIANGFNLSMQPHCVSANYNLVFRKYKYSPRKNRLINPYRLGFANPYVKTHFNMPYEIIGITEAQKYLNSRMSMYFPEWQSRWYEQHGHNHLDIYLDTQRPMLIDVNVRELSQFIEIIKLEKLYKDNQLIGLKWHIRRIDSSSAFDKYIASGKKDSECYTDDVIVADYNVFNCYDSFSCKPKFYEGHMEEDYDINYATDTVQTLEDYRKYLENNDDELPENYYQRRKAS